MASNSNSGYASSRPKILYVEDSPPQALKVKLALESNGCQVMWVDTGWARVEMAKSRHFDLLCWMLNYQILTALPYVKKSKPNQTWPKCP
jgi:DNA-binding response OmpR family regulator